MSAATTNARNRLQTVKREVSNLKNVHGDSETLRALQALQYVVEELLTAVEQLEQKP